MDPRRLSTTSLALSDDLAVYSTSPSHPAPDAYSSYAYGPGGGADTSFDHHALDASFRTPSPSLGGGHSRRSSSGAGGGGTGRGGDGRRSRARAFSVLSAPHRQALFGGGGNEEEGLGEGAFEGGAYDRAFDALEMGEDEDEEEEEEGIEMRERRTGEDSALPLPRGGGVSGGKAARTRFQPLEREEVLWMGVSAAAVLGLTAGAVVLAFVG
ncbi:hypothetical protein JCM1840_005587 [Sporobolomyces johnsonii]